MKKKILLLFFAASLLCATNVPAAGLRPQKKTASILEIPAQDQPVRQNIIDSIKTGFFHENGHTRYYARGVLHTGFLNLDGKKYYFNEEGALMTGFQKIKDDFFYFDSQGVMQTGLTKINSKKYCFHEKTGKKIFGAHKIGSHWYYFDDETGEMTTGFQTKKDGDAVIRTYYNEKGQLKTGAFQASDAAYEADEKTGQIHSMKNLAEAVCQRPELPTGCEITSWTMMASYAGVDMNKIRAANLMPASSDPNQGFVGSPYSSSGGGLVVYPGGLKSITEERLGGFVDMTGCTLDDLREKLWERHLVLIWVTRLDGFDSHTVALTGYDAEGFFFNDPWTGEESWLSEEELTEFWEGNGRRAMSY